MLFRSLHHASAYVLHPFQAGTVLHSGSLVLRCLFIQFLLQRLNLQQCKEITLNTPSCKASPANMFYVVINIWIQTCYAPDLALYQLQLRKNNWQTPEQALLPFLNRARPYDYRSLPAAHAL